MGLVRKPNIVAGRFFTHEINIFKLLLTGSSNVPKMSKVSKMAFSAWGIPSFVPLGPTVIVTTLLFFFLFCHKTQGRCTHQTKGNIFFKFLLHLLSQQLPKMPLLIGLRGFYTSSWEDSDTSAALSDSLVGTTVVHSTRRHSQKCVVLCLRFPWQPECPKNRQNDHFCSCD